MITTLLVVIVVVSFGPMKKEILKELNEEEKKNMNQ